MHGIHAPRQNQQYVQSANHLIGIRKDKMKEITKTGDRYSHLRVLKLSRKIKYIKYWECVCDCGKITVVQQGNLRDGHTISCGCFGRKIQIQKQSTHKMTGTPLHQKWTNMLNRCRNKKLSCYKHYGGRGITVCIRWKKFENFYEDMSESYKISIKKNGKANTTLDRIDNNKGYSKSNCRWATLSEQAFNRRPKSK